MKSIKIWAAVCALLIIAVHAFFSKTVAVLANDGVFIVVDIIGLAVFAISAVLAVKHHEDPNKDHWRKVFLWAAGAVILWVGCWCAQYNADKSSGVEYKYNKKTSVIVK